MFINNIQVVLEGIKIIVIKRRDGQESIINGVMYVPSIKNNMISPCQLLKKNRSMNLVNKEF